MEIRQIKYFVHAAQGLNFTEAARLSNVAQSTLSLGIRQLENELGETLFDRIGKRVVLTEVGRAFLPYAQKLLLDASYGTQIINDIRGLEAGVIHIGVAYGLSNLLTMMIPEFHKLHPKVKLEVKYETRSTIVDLLQNGDIDFGLAFGKGINSPEIEKESLFTSRLCGVMHESHALAKHAELDVEQLRGQALVLPAKGMSGRMQFEEHARKAAVPVSPVIEVNALPMLINLLHTGRWVAVLPDTVVMGERGLVARPLVGNVMPLDACILKRKDAYHRRAVEAFWEVIREHVRIQEMLK